MRLSGEHRLEENNLVLSDRFEDELNKSNILSESPKIVALALRILEDLRDLERMTIGTELFDKVKDLQLACIRHHLNSILVYQSQHYYRWRYPYPQILHLLNQFLKTQGSHNPLGRNGDMLSAHAKSKTLEGCRSKLLLDCQMRLLAIEDQHEKDDNNPEANPLEVDSRKIEQTRVLVLQLLQGVPEGKFPQMRETYVEMELKQFFDFIWVYLRNAFFKSPLGVYLALHHDRDLYNLLMELTQNPGAPCQLKPIWQVFETLPNKYPCPQERLISLFKWLTGIIHTKAPLQAQQCRLKEILQEFAKVYGVDESSVKELAFNSAQRRVNFASMTGTLRKLAFIQEDKQSPHFRVLKAIHDIAISEETFAEDIRKLMNGDTKTQGSFQLFISKLKLENLSDIQRKQIQTVEVVYASLLSNLQAFSKLLSGCVNSDNTVIEKLNCLFSSVIGNDREIFTQYMLHLTVTAIFIKKFVEEFKKMLVDSNSKAEVTAVEVNMARCYQHLMKISMDFEQLCGLVGRENWSPQAGDQNLQAQLMLSRAKYFSGVVDVLGEFISGEDDYHFTSDINDLEDQTQDPVALRVRRERAIEEFREKRASKFIEFIGALELKEEIKERCGRWLEQWDQTGELPLADIMTTIGKYISGDINDADSRFRLESSGMN